MSQNEYGAFQYEMDGFASYFPSHFKDMVSWTTRGHSTIIATLRDGSIVEYNHKLNTIRLVREYDGNESSYRRELSIRLIELMEEKGIDQHRLSEMSGVTQPTISNYIHRRTTPSGYVIRKLEEVLGCPRGYLTNF